MICNGNFSDINNRQNERPFVCFHDMFGKKIHNYLEDIQLNCDQHLKAWPLGDF